MPAPEPCKRFIARCPRAPELLLDAGADPWARNAAGQTPLHAAAAAGRDEVVRALLMALLESVDPEKARRYRARPSTDLLDLPATARERLVDRAGRTPLHDAASSQHRIFEGRLRA